MIFRMPVFRHLILGSLCIIAFTGCGTRYVQNAEILKPWKAKPSSCVKATANDELVVQHGRLVAKDFTWANSEIEFSLFSPADASFTLYFYDQNFASVRRKYADKWFEQEGGRTIPLSESENLWKVDRVHAMGLGGDNDLYEQDLRAFGGQLTTSLAVEGIPENQRVVIFAENFKVNEWNHVVVRINEGLMTVSVNGEASGSIQTFPELNGRIEFEVETGSIRLKNVSCEKISKEEEQCTQQQDNSQS